MTKSATLTEGHLGRGILLFSLPLMCSNLLQVLFNMADIAVVGRFSGSAALGAVGSTTILITLFTGILIGVGSGVNVICARHIGARNSAAVRETVHTSLLLCILCGLLISVFGVLAGKGILQLLNTRAELLDGALLYLRIYVLGMPALAVYNFGNGVYSAAGNTKKPLLFLSISGVINVALNLLFVIGFRMSVAGVAVASVISQYISAALILISLARSREDHGLQLSLIRLHADKAKAVLGLGLPAGMQNAIFQLANLFIQAGVNSFDAATVAGSAAAANADAIAFDVMAAFYTACSSFMGQNYGAGKRKRVLKSYYISLAYSFGVGTALGAGIALCGDAFLSMFTSDPAVVAAGKYCLLVKGTFYGVSAFMDCTIAASRGIGKSVMPTVIVILGSCVFRVIWVYTIFAFIGTLTSLYLLYAFSWALTGLFEILYFVHAWRRLPPE